MSGLADVMAELGRANRELENVRAAYASAGGAGVLTEALKRKLLEAEAIHNVAVLSVLATWRCEGHVAHLMGAKALEQKFSPEEPKKKDSYEAWVDGESL